MPPELRSEAAATPAERLAVRRLLGPQGAWREAELWAESCGERARYRAACVRACLRARFGEGDGGRNGGGGGDDATNETGDETDAAPSSSAAALRAAALDAMQLALRSRGAGSGLVVCRSCKSGDVSIEARQTRSADEGMTLFMQCNACGCRWRG